MDDKENKRDRLLNMPKEYEQNPEIVQRVIRETMAKKAERKTSWFYTHWKKIAVGAASLVLAVGIFLPVYFSLQKPQEVVYYESTMVEMVELSDMDAFVAENGIAANYFTYQTVKNQYAKVTESGAIAYLMQDMTYINSNGFDVVNMKAVVLKNSEFEFEKDFVLAKQELNVGEITINYFYKAEEVGDKINIFAKFAYEDVKYYLEIDTKNEAEAALEQYVTMLLG